MTSAFRFNIDTSDITRAFKELSEAPKMFNNGLREAAAQIMELVGGANIFSSALFKIADLSSLVGKSLTRWLIPFTMMTQLASNLLSILKNVIMLPFGVLTKAFSAAKGIWDSFTSAASGSLERSQNARKYRTTYGNLKALERTGEMNQVDLVSVLAGISEAINDPNKQGAFAGLGLDANELRKMDGTAALQKLFSAMMEKGVGADSLEAKALFEALGLGDFIDADEFRAMASILPRINADFKQMHKEYKNLEGVERASMRLKFAFDDISNKLTAKFAPILLPLANVFSQIVSKVGDAFINSGAATKLKDTAMGLSNKFLAWINGGGLQRAIDKIPQLLDTLYKVMQQFTRYLLIGLNKVGIVNDETVKTALGLIGANSYEFMSASDRQKVLGETNQHSYEIAPELEKHFGVSQGVAYNNLINTQTWKDYIEREKQFAGRQYDVKVKVDNNKLMLRTEARDGSYKSEWETIEIRQQMNKATL